MIQDISPKKLFNHYEGSVVPSGSDVICAFHEDRILCKCANNDLKLPTRSELAGIITKDTYLFAIDSTSWFLCEIDPNASLPEGYTYENVREHRKLLNREIIYGEMTAWHLYVWYRDNRFCGRCGHPTRHDKRLRMLACPDCGNMIFPKICPAVIVGVVKDDKILLTRYAGRAYKHYALIAGFTEIGETAEETVEREVFEEAGLRVKNIRYWNTQPWGIDSDLLLGYFCEPDGDDSITIDTEELSTAAWVSRSEIDFIPDNVSLTHDMIRAFMEDRVPPMPERS